MGSPNGAACIPTPPAPIILYKLRVIVAGNGTLSVTTQRRPMTQKFYITTPIYYVNGAPHIGHATPPSPPT